MVSTYKEVVQGSTTCESVTDGCGEQTPTRATVAQIDENLMQARNVSTPWKCIQWACMHQHWTMEPLKKLAWSDESCRQHIVYLGKRWHRDSL